MSDICVSGGWTEEEARQLLSQRVRLVKPMSGFQPGIMGSVTRVELIGDQWVAFVEWHLAVAEPFEDPFDRAEWNRYLEFW